MITFSNRQDKSKHQNQYANNFFRNFNSQRLEFGNYKEFLRFYFGDSNFYRPFFFYDDINYQNNNNN